MRASIVSADVKAIGPFRERMLQQLHSQFVTWSWLERGWCDAFLLNIDEQPAGYAVVGGLPRERRDTIVEFHVDDASEEVALALFDALVLNSNAKRVRGQTNDQLLTRMMELRCDATTIERDAMLFSAGRANEPPVPGAVFRPIAELERENVFPHASEPEGDWVIDMSGKVVATGGWLTHYNPPFVDVYMEVAPEHRRRGFGSMLVREIQRECIARGLTPAARCGVANIASQRTLAKAGLTHCGWLMTATIACVKP